MIVQLIWVLIWTIGATMWIVVIVDCIDLFKQPLRQRGQHVAGKRTRRKTRR